MTSKTRSGSSNNGQRRSSPLRRNRVVDHGSVSSSSSRPGMSVIHAPPLVRDDLSDLSGSYLNGATAPRRTGSATASTRSSSTHQNNSSNASNSTTNHYQRPWRQARILSAREPTHPQPRLDDDSIGAVRKTSVLVDRLGVVEIGGGSSSSGPHPFLFGHDLGEPGLDDFFRQSGSNIINNNNNNSHDPFAHPAMLNTTTSGSSGGDLDCSGVVVGDHAARLRVPSLEQLSLNSSGSSAGGCLEVEHYRVPLILLLMDPGRKQYELMQLWVDAGVDTVRDVLLALQQNLTDQWRQDYDGIFQVVSRDDRLEIDQLIHVLPIANYDVRPHEVWVAKPWAMAAKATIPYVQYVTQHLQGLGVVQYADNNSDATNFRRRRPIRRRQQSQKPDQRVLVLSNDAQSRMYVPEGILKHHHASQFLSFSPPFERPNANNHNNNPAANESRRSNPSNPVRVDVLAVGADDGTDAESSVTCSTGTTKNNNNNNDHHSKASTKLRSNATTSSKSTTSRRRRLDPHSLAAQEDGFESVEAAGGSEDRRRHARRRSLGSMLLCNLNCQKREDQDGDDARLRLPHVQLLGNDSYETVDHTLDTSASSQRSSGGGFLWKVWEDESLCESAHTESSRRPLLINGGGGSPKNQQRQPRHRRHRSMADF